jgi:hypothetical protein
VASSAGRPTDELLQLYALEGLLDRLSGSPHAEHLVLKGGALLAAFDARRPTRDVDLAAIDITNDLDDMHRLVNPKADGTVPVSDYSYTQVELVERAAKRAQDRSIHRVSRS